MEQLLHQQPEIQFKCQRRAFLKACAAAVAGGIAQTVLGEERANSPFDVQIWILEAELDRIVGELDRLNEEKMNLHNHMANSEEIREKRLDEVDEKIDEFLSEFFDEEQRSMLMLLYQRRSLIMIRNPRYKRPPNPFTLAGSELPKPFAKEIRALENKIPRKEYWGYSKKYRALREERRQVLADCGTFFEDALPAEQKILKEMRALKREMKRVKKELEITENSDYA